MKDYDGACEDLKEAIKLDTTDPNDCQAELIKYEKYAKAARKESDNRMRKAMQGGLFATEEKKEEVKTEEVKEEEVPKEVKPEAEPEEKKEEPKEEKNEEMKE